MISTARPLALGSASPRRRDILSDLGVPFFACPADIDETPHEGEAARDYLERIVASKLEAVVDKLRGRADGLASPGDNSPNPCAGVLVADTTVVVDQLIVGKPQNTEEAFLTLLQLCGRQHIVMTRYGLLVPSEEGSEPRSQFRTVESRVSLRPASRKELRRYADTGEGLDKAGAYAVQGVGSFLVQSINGSYSNVVGLPACEVVQDLRDVGLLPEFPHVSG